MAQVLELQNKAEVTYGQNQAYWYQNTIDTFSTELPELAYGNITPKEFCKKLSESAAKNQEQRTRMDLQNRIPANPFFWRKYENKK